MGTKSLERLRSEALNKRTAQLAEDKVGISVLEKLSGVLAGKLTKRPPKRPLRLDDNDFRNQREAELARQKEQLLKETK